MASPDTQSRWREKHHAVKRQLNVMARSFIHDTLTKIAETENLRGKAEAVTFSTFVTMALEEHADLNPDARRLLDLYRDAYARDRKMYAP